MEISSVKSLMNTVGNSSQPRVSITRKTSNDVPPAASGSFPRKELINAMTLLQTANGIIQEALEVSGKLRSLAMTSFTTGNTNINSIQEAISGIQSSLKMLGGTFVPPSIQEQSLSKDEISEINRNIEKLIKFNNNASANNDSDSESKNLSYITSTINNRINKIYKSLGVYPFDPKDIESIKNDTASKIISENTNLINIQGNASNARSLLTST